MNDQNWFVTLDVLTQLLITAARVGLTVIVFFALAAFIIFAFGGRG